MKWPWMGERLHKRFQYHLLNFLVFTAPYVSTTWLLALRIDGSAPAIIAKSAPVSDALTPMLIMTWLAPLAAIAEILRAPPLMGGNDPADGDGGRPRCCRRLAERTPFLLTFGCLWLFLVAIPLHMVAFFEASAAALVESGSRSMRSAPLRSRNQRSAFGYVIERTVK